MSNQPGETERCLAALRRGHANALAALLDHYRPRLSQMVRLRIDPRLAARVDPSDVVRNPDRGHPVLNFVSPSLKEPVLSRASRRVFARTVRAQVR